MPGHIARSGLAALFAAIGAWGPVCFAADRALIMTISDYAGVNDLPGVRLDADNARKILAGIGFGSDDLRIVDGTRLTLAGMHDALAQLAHDTADGDRVFVYFSGHGTSYSVGDRCEQALVSQDLKPFSSREFLRYLTDLRDRTSRVVVVLDACFSGGVAQAADQGTRSLSPLKPKYSQLSGTARCSTPVNLTAADLAGLRSLKGAINLERNYVYLAAARDNEVAFDDRLRGGVASSALVDCLAAVPPDVDHSGSVSFGELTVCAQGRINQRYPHDDTRQHLVITGNDGLPVMAAADTPSKTHTNPAATLHDLSQAADARWDVRATPSVRTLAIGRDSFNITVTSNRGGFLYIVYVGSDRREFLKLYPTTSAEPNTLQAGQPFTVPKEWRSDGPAGTDYLLVLVTPQPRDLDSVFGRHLAVPATYEASSALPDALGLCRNRAAQSCQSAQSRNLRESDSGPLNSGGYGATLVTVEEAAN
jgi:Caspase domain/Domain of unknown function (DUF4384)